MKGELGFVIMVVLGILMVISLDGAINDDPQPNNEPYTGLCVRASSQGGC